MGWSPMHASSVALVHNLMTGHLPPQFHAVFGPWFETVHENGNEPPRAWDVMMQGRHHEVEVEVGEARLEPTLQNDWLTKEELAVHRIEEQQSLKSNFSKTKGKQEGERVQNQQSQTFLASEHRDTAKNQRPPLLLWEQLFEFWLVCRIST